jgi:hypothetical protein
MKRACRGCGIPTGRGAYCARCAAKLPPAPKDPTSWNRRRSRSEQHAFRLAVLERDGYRCRCRGIPDGCDRPHPDPCGATRDLQAHHVRPGTSVDDGVCLCAPCHRAIDPHAR